MKRSTHNVALAISCAASLAQSVYALPSAERYAQVAILGEGDSKPIIGQDGPIFLEDHDDPNIVYAPYDQVFVTPKEGEASQEPQFGLTYDRKGGLLCFTVRAGYSQLRRKQIASYLADGKQVKPLFPIDGNWSLTLQARNGESIFLAPPTEIKSVLPDVPVAMCSLLNKDAIRYVVASYLTGAGLGVNYNYQFRAVLTPMQIKASVHWRRLQDLIQTETLTSTTAKVAGSGSYLAFSADGKASYTTVDQVRRITKIGLEKKIIKVWYRGGGGQSANEALDQRLLDEVTKVVMGQVFKPVNSEWQLIAPNQPQTSCEVNLKQKGSLFGLRQPFGFNTASCFARATSYVYNSELIFEDREYTYEVTSESIVTLPAAVGTNFSYMCRDYPALFVNLEDKEHPFGCPTYYPALVNDPNDIVKTEYNPAAPEAKMPEASATTAPKVEAGKVPAPMNDPNAEPEDVVDMARYMRGI